MKKTKSKRVLDTEAKRKLLEKYLDRSASLMVIQEQLKHFYPGNSVFSVGKTRKKGKKARRRLG